MTDNADVNIRPNTGWLLLAEFTVASSPSGKQHLAEQVHEMMRELGLQPLQVKRIQLAALAAVQTQLLHGQKAGQISPVHIRIWVAGKYPCDRGWGFFLVRKLGSGRENAAARIDYFVELFLYQEPHNE